jgi:hypothetical protein
LTQQRRIFTDGRSFPAEDEFETSFQGYSIGKWIDEDGDGRYDVLEVETRLLKNPRTFDPSGTPFHKDGKTIIKERLFLDPADRNILHDVITTYDNALTRPWVVDKKYVRVPQPIFVEASCPEGNPHLRIGGEFYMRGVDDLLMPAKKNQRPPDLRHFKSAPK